MGTPATIYQYGDSGAPETRDDWEESPAYFMEVMKACLVDGYGNKPAAGWAVVYEDMADPLHARIAFSNGNGVIEFCNVGSNYLAVFIWDSIITPGTGQMDGSDWAAQMSEGINGWQGPLNPAAQDGTGRWTTMRVNSLRFDLTDSDSYWTVFANDKSVLFLCHPGPDSSRNVIGNDLYSNSSDTPSIFFGAVKSPEIARDEPGNFYVQVGPNTNKGSRATSSQEQLYENWFGLRTPLGSVPDPDGSYEVTSNHSQTFTYNHNPFSPIRNVIPLALVYMGDDNPHPSGDKTGRHHGYLFAVVPGVAEFAYNNFWEYWAPEHAVNKLYEFYNLAGYNWFPFTIRGSISNSAGITDHADWWT